MILINMLSKQNNFIFNILFQVKYTRSIYEGSVSLILKVFTQTMLTNNDILKKLRVALSLRDEDIVEILSLVDFKITKGALGDFFRKDDHPGYIEAGDQVLRNFLNGLIIYKRGKKVEEEKKNILPGNQDKKR